MPLDVGRLDVVGLANDQRNRLFDPLVRRGPAAIGDINGANAWYAQFEMRLVHWRSSLIENGAASAAGQQPSSRLPLTKARPGKLGVIAACPTDRRRTV